MSQWYHNTLCSVCATVLVRRFKFKVFNPRSLPVFSEFCSVSRLCQALLWVAARDNTKVRYDLSFLGQQITSCLPSAAVMSLANRLFEGTFDRVSQSFIFRFSWTLWINLLKYATKPSLIIDCSIQLLRSNSLSDSVCNCQREEVAFKCYYFSLYFWQTKYFISGR